MEDYTEIYKNYDVSKNVTDPILTKYEYTKILGMRAQQIANNSEPLIEVTKDLDNPIAIAKEEIRQRKSPIILKRKIGEEQFEYWKLEDLKNYN
uniref:RNA polymerase Rpb6 n=1 Tax=Mimiviridae sp. ChoanoV1 TaxID=2596887 RepID=A0A5B8HV40_9VIRU|nr:RNA polymerase Rpb6 [Mimiviridae sp. ChoanoV1]